MSNIFQKKKLVTSMSQAPNFVRLLCRTKFESQHKNHTVKNCRKNCISCSYLLKASVHQFKRVNKKFLLKNSFNPIQEGGNRPPWTWELAHKTFRLLVLILFLHWCKFQVCTYWQFQIIDLIPLLKKRGFSDQILIKLKLW